MTDELLVASRRGENGKLGGLLLAGLASGAHGPTTSRTVRFPSFGMTFVRSGVGTYRDERQTVDLRAGSVVFVFPGHPHWYGPSHQRGWDEAFLVFDGPLFRLALETGTHRPDRPVLRLSPVSLWLRRVDQFRLRRPPRDAAERDAEACEILKLVIDMRAADGPAKVPVEVGTDWYPDSRSLLEADIGRSLPLQQIAASVGLPYETWRRYFRRRSGYSPARYRLIQRLDAATTLLDETSLSSREIAAALGFSDERHFARHFQAVFGMTPRQRRVRTGTRPVRTTVDRSDRYP